MSLFPEPRIQLNVCLLSSVSIPLTLPDINSELDELDREEFYRLKKVSNKKQRDNAAADAEIAAAREKEGQSLRDMPAERDVPEAPDVLGEQEDTDVIF